MGSETLENQLYGPGWKLCEKCGVTQPAANLELKPEVREAVTHSVRQCIDAVRCERWRVSLLKK